MNATTTPSPDYNFDCRSEGQQKLIISACLKTSSLLWGELGWSRDSRGTVLALSRSSPRPLLPGNAMTLNWIPIFTRALINYISLFDSIRSDKASLVWDLFQFALTNYHSLGDFPEMNFVTVPGAGSPSSGFGRFGFFRGVAPRLGGGAVSLCPPMAFPQCVSSYKDTRHIGLRPSLMTSFYLNYIFKSPISKYSHILR